MTRRLALSAVALAVFLGHTAGTALAACTAPVKSPAYDNPADQNDAGGVHANQWIAESFIATADGTLNRVSLYLQKGVDPITIEIHSYDTGKPGALLGKRTLSLTNAAYAFVDVDFSSDGIPLSRGMTYYIVATSNAGNSGSWGFDKTSPAYFEGDAFISNNSGASWIPSSSTTPFDLLFQVWGQTCTAGALPPSQGAPALAAVSGLVLGNGTFAAESTGPSATLGRKSRAPRGTRVGYTLNEAATVVFTVKRRANGRRVTRGKKRVCVRPTRKNRRKKRCTRLVRVRGSFSLNGAAGSNSFHFTGRLNGKKLRPGRYRLVATPSVNGQRGKAASAGFRIVR